MCCLGPDGAKYTIGPAATVNLRRLSIGGGRQSATIRAAASSRSATTASASIESAGRPSL